jgi:hypothetical protein
MLTTTIMMELTFIIGFVMLRVVCTSSILQFGAPFIIDPVMLLMRGKSSRVIYERF